MGIPTGQIEERINEIALSISDRIYQRTFAEVDPKNSFTKGDLIQNKTIADRKIFNNKFKENKSNSVEKVSQKIQHEISCQEQKVRAERELKKAEERKEILAKEIETLSTTKDRLELLIQTRLTVPF